MPKGSGWKQSTLCKRGWQVIFFTKIQSSCTHESADQVMLAHSRTQRSQQLTRTMGRTIAWAVGTRTPWLFVRSAILPRALQTHQALCLTLFLCGIFWGAGCCGGFSQVCDSSSRWEWQEFSRAAFKVVRNRCWRSKELLWNISGASKPHWFLALLSQDQPPLLHL